MSHNRIRLAISGVSAGATEGDTGLLWGRVEQFRWYPTTVDTGQSGTITLAVLPDMADTGVGWSFFSQASVNLGVGQTRAPTQPQHGSDGVADPADTGAAFGVPIVGANDRLRVKIIPGDTGMVIAGNLYVWSCD